ncbi:unnamed protein product [Sphagnum jensenii]|uniref:U4/U6.U5 small nuclear ribonucleoprotein 27kDa protein domain-containing protein n=1 Tax=Sphagnum jensenii TaxID=128206 RepID=A0ABP0XC13_9BRYO
MYAEALCASNVGFEVFSVVVSGRGVLLLCFVFAVDRRRERERGGGDRERDRDRERDSRDWERERDRDRDRDRDRRRVARSRSRSPVNDRHRRSDSPVDRHGDRGHKTTDERRDGSRRERERSRDRGYGPEVDKTREKVDKKVVADKRDKGGESFNGLDSQRAAIVAQFVDGIASEQHKGGEGPLSSTPPVLEDNNDDDVMKKLGIPTTFNTTKGKYVADTNHSAVKLTTKRQPRQYMNRRGGFNRPLPAESNR